MRSVPRVIGVYAIAVGAIILVGARWVDAAGTRPASASPVGGLAGAEAELRRSAAELVEAQAAMIQAVAQARKLHAETLKMLEERRSMALDNDAKATETFYQKRRTRERFLAEHARKRPSRETVVSRCNATRPDRPSACQLDPVRGTIHWPEALQGEQYEAYRTRLEALYAGRTPANSGLGSEFCRQVEELASQMAGSLRSMIRQMSPTEYMAARRFIEGLAYEARFLPDVEGIART